jgi:hypothetical protein
VTSYRAISLALQVTFEKFSNLFNLRDLERAKRAKRFFLAAHFSSPNASLRAPVSRGLARVMRIGILALRSIRRIQDGSSANRVRREKVVVHSGS